MSITRIGKYTIERELGHGGFGRVYLGFDPDIGRKVAIKLLLHEHGSDPDLLKRFQHEIPTTGSLHHKNIVTIYASGEEAGRPYLVMEYLEGSTLKNAILEPQQLPLLTKVRIMTQVAEGLAYAHSRGVIHRDIKPENIMLLPDGSVKIMDFGIALAPGLHTSLTATGGLIGTPLYLAPEQIAGSKATELTDIFSFGGVYYELLTGTHPFRSFTGDWIGLQAAIMNHNPPLLTSVVPECPEALELLIHRAIAKAPELRYRNFEELLLDSEAILVDLQHERAKVILQEVPLLVERGDFEAALKILRQVQQLEPGNKDARRFREIVAQQIQRAQIRSKIAELLTESHRYSAQRRFAESVQALENAVRLDPEDCTLQDALAKARASLTEMAQATRLVSECRLLLQKGDLTGALENLRSALRVDPEHAEAKLLYEKVRDQLERRRDSILDSTATLRPVEVDRGTSDVPPPVSDERVSAFPPALEAPKPASNSRPVPDTAPEPVSWWRARIAAALRSQSLRIAFAATLAFFLCVISLLWDLVSSSGRGKLDPLESADTALITLLAILLAIPLIWAAYMLCQRFHWFPTLQERCRKFAQSYLALACELLVGSIIGVVGYTLTAVFPGMLAVVIVSIFAVMALAILVSPLGAISLMVLLPFRALFRYVQRRFKRHTPAPAIPQPRQAAVDVIRPRIRVTRKQVLIVLASISLMWTGWMLAADIALSRRVSRFEHYLQTAHPSGNEIWTKWTELASDGSSSGALSSARAIVKIKLVESADQVISRYRESGRVSADEWKDAREDLMHALSLGPDEPLRGKLLLCDGHIARINSLSHPTPAELSDARAKFFEANKLIPLSPDPPLGLADLYIYGYLDVSTGYQWLQEAQRRGYSLGIREKTHLADGYLAQGDRSASQGSIDTAKVDYQHALELFQAAPWGNAAEIATVQDRLAKLNAPPPEPKLTPPKKSRPHRTPAQ
jgi:serine/threonine protein kinase